MDVLTRKIGGKIREFRIYSQVEADAVALEKQERNDLTRVVQHWDEVQETLARP